MGKTKKKTMMTMGAAAAAGLALSVSAITANAAEAVPDPVDGGITEEANAAAPLSIEDAEAAANAAREEMIRAQMAADLAFEEAKSGAREADALAGQELESAQKRKEDAEEALEKAEADAEAASEQAKGIDPEEANAAYEEAAGEVRAAQGSVDQAKAAEETAEEALAQAEAVLQEKEAALASAEQDKEAAGAAAVQAQTLYDQTAEAAAEAAEKDEAAESAAKALEEAEENYRQGMIGFIDWMLAKEDITDEQVRDLQYAKALLEEAQEKTFADFNASPGYFPESRNDKVVVVGDENDAVDLKNIIKSVEIMKTINELRKTDDNYTGDLQRDASLTSFYLMAYAQYATMRGAGVMDHTTLSVGCENLAWGYDEPTDGWYYMEKKDFDAVRDDLVADGTITGIRSASDIAAVSREALKRGKIVGHYTNLMFTAYQVMGVGYSQYGYTSAYNADSAARYDGSRSARAVSYALYTVEDFEDLLLEYYAGVDKEPLQKAYEEALAKKEEAQDRLLSLLNGSDLSELQQALQEADAGNAAADAALAKAKSERDEASRSVDDASEVLRDAVEKSAEAQRILGEKEEAADAAEAVRAAVIAAENAGEVLLKAQEQFAAAEDALAQAQAERAKAADRLARAEGLSAEEALHNAIEDEDFAYLNEYIDAVRDAQDQMDEANRIYSLALADLAIAQDQAGILQPAVQVIPKDHTALTEAKHESKPAVTAAETSRQERTAAAPARQIGTSAEPAKQVSTSATPVKTVGKGSVPTTGDGSCASLLAELLASVGVMGAMLKRRKI